MGLTVINSKVLEKDLCQGGDKCWVEVTCEVGRGAKVLYKGPVYGLTHKFSLGSLERGYHQKVINITEHHQNEDVVTALVTGHVFNIHANFTQCWNVNVNSFLEWTFELIRKFHHLTNVAPNNVGSHVVGQVGAEKLLTEC